jgi:tryptophan synthase alpha chain
LQDKDGQIQATHSISAGLDYPGVGPEHKEHATLIAYITVGYPNLEAVLEAVPLLEKCGVDMVELGIPFSDPLADGLTIQQASCKAPQNGITPAACLEVARLIRQKSDLPLLFMTGHL